MVEDKSKLLTMYSKQGSMITISPEDFYLVEHQWSDIEAPNTTYARGYVDGQRSLHRIVMGRMIGRRVKPFEDVDHVDGNGLNCARSNLRLATATQNGGNARLSKANTSGYKGVSFNKAVNKWNAKIRADGKLKDLGCYDTPQEAHEVYKKAAVVYFGSFARFGDSPNSPIISAEIERLESARNASYHASKLYENLLSLIEALPANDEIRFICEDTEPVLLDIRNRIRGELAKAMDRYDKILFT